jgi:hypothetical protein
MLDWVVFGDPRGLICTAVARSSAAALIDPVFAAIDAHTKAGKAFEERVRENGKLQMEIAYELRQSSITAFEEKIIESDDPRWIASEKAVHAACYAAENAAIDLLAVQPTTLAGTCALLNYFGENEQDGWGLFFPEHVDYYDNGKAVTFHAAVALHVSKAIAEIGVSFKV